LNISAPLMCLFGASAKGVTADQLRSKIAAVYATQLSTIQENDLMLLYHGVSIAITILKPDFSASQFRGIFTHFNASQSLLAITLSLGEHVGSAQYVPSVVRTLLSVGAEVAAFDGVSAILWKPAALVSDPGYFIECSKSYANGGAFPVLSTVSFTFDDKAGKLSTSGLDWFAGQELVLIDSRRILSETELMKRAVRLVHDIAVNGPIVFEQNISDIEPCNRISLKPDATGKYVQAIFNESGP
jgi:hypothetical protein